jgi:hypothetical protein
VQLATAGRYHCVATSGSFIDPSAPAELVVVDNSASSRVLNLAGTTTLTLGPPSHLSVDDWATLLRNVRGPTSRPGQFVVGSSSLADDPQARWTPPAAPISSHPLSGPAGPGQIRNPVTPPGAVRLKWALKPGQTANKYTIVPGRVYSDGSAVTLTGASTEFTPAASSAVCLVDDKIKFQSTPSAGYDDDEPPIHTRVIVEFLSADPGDGAIPLGDLWARWRVPDSDLERIAAIIDQDGTATLTYAFAPL